MASRVTHLVISKKLEEMITVKNQNDFQLGNILPDAIIRQEENHVASHFKVTIDDNKRKMMDFQSYYNKFEEKIKSDDLYLGYFFHLVSDAIYRKLSKAINFKRNNHNQFLEELYKDYSILNTYLIEKHDLRNTTCLKDKFKEEAINDIYAFEADAILNELSGDFENKVEGKTIHLTEDMMDEYIIEAVSYCKNLYDKMKTSNFSLSPRDFAWNR